MRALQAESVPRIRMTLLNILELRQKPDLSNDDDFNLDGLTDTQRSLTEIATEHFDISALIRHELSPAIGWIRHAAAQEIPNFASSSTNQAIRKLQRRIDGLVTVIKAGEDLNLTSVTLPDILSENWPDSKIAPHLESDGTMERIGISTDEGLFSLLLSNIFQNALDASANLGGGAAVHIVWGHTHRNYWIRVTNPFEGDRFSLSDVLAVGSSSKSSHQGQGLALVQAIADRLLIAVTLEGHSGIASFTLSGTRDDE
jgi:signal transduction histidine kinase